MGAGLAALTNSRPIRLWILFGTVAALALVFAVGRGDVGPDTGANRARTYRSELRTSLDGSPRHPVPGEHVVFTGALRPAVSRPIALQEFNGSEWVTNEAGRTDEQGRFAITTTAAASRRFYRVRAERTTVVTDGTPSVYTKTVTARQLVRPVTATAKFEVAPAPVSDGSPGANGPLPAGATFSPARPGRTVTLLRRDDGRWKPLATSEQDEDGRAAFEAPVLANRRTVRLRAVAAASNGAPAVVTPPAEVVALPLAWRDEFAGNQLDTSVWEYRQLGLRAGSRLCAESSDRAVTVRQGRLRLRVRNAPPRDPQGCEHGEYLNGHIGTQASFSFRYGVMAARIRFQPEDGQHGALWSQPTDSAEVPGDPGVSGAEIDAIEYFGDDFANGAIQHSVYWLGADGEYDKVGGYENRNYLLSPGETWSNSFHVYSVEWTPTEYIFRVDGRETYRTSKGVSQIPQYVILSLLTSDWELPKLDPERSRPMQVDWVRVWSSS